MMHDRHLYERDEPAEVPKPVDLAVGKYRCITEIGRGAMAVIYLALGRTGLGGGGFDKLVVVKVLRPELAAQEEMRELFVREARLAVQLNHANVVQSYDSGMDSGHFYITMEHLDGQPWSRICWKGEASTLLPLTSQIQVLSDVLVGLHYAHEL